MPTVFWAVLTLAAMVVYLNHAAKEDPQSLDRRAGWSPQDHELHDIGRVFDYERDAKDLAS